MAGRRLVVALTVVGLLAFAAVASARFLPYSYAYLAAQKDVREHSSDLVGTPTSSGIESCHRASPQRVECAVYAESKEFIIDPNPDGSTYKHKRCTWTVVSHYRRGSSLVYYFRRDTQCHSWVDESPFS